MTTESPPDAEPTTVDCEINGKAATLRGHDVDPVAPVLRAHGLLSVRESCTVGVCGSCAILLDGQPHSSCLLPLYALRGRAVRTTEGLECDGELNDLQQEFIRSQAFQCSFCTPGFLMGATALLERTEGELSAAEVTAGLKGHICRCGSYVAIVEAVRACSVRRAHTASGAPA